MTVAAAATAALKGMAYVGQRQQLAGVAAGDAGEVTRAAQQAPQEFDLSEEEVQLLLQHRRRQLAIGQGAPG